MDARQGVEDQEGRSPAEELQASVTRDARCRAARPKFAEAPGFAFNDLG